MAFLMSELGLREKFASQPSVAPEDADVAALARAGKLIDAIKLYRQKHGVGLAEAKAVVEALIAARS